LVQDLENLYQEELLKASIRSQENERERIARDLHDEVGVMLSTIKLNVDLGLKISNLEQDKVESVRSSLKGLIESSIKSVRRISHGLLPPVLDHFGLVAAVEELVNDLNSSPIKFALEYSKDEIIRFEKTVELGLFRIVQEAVNNAVKHSGANSINISMKSDSDKLTIQIIDDGKGFLQNKESNGLGLKNMESRSRVIGASFNFLSEANIGTTITVVIPVKK
ncbi:MAG: sensor histidine kinase, partial [Cyclobacteriaceae bacterium]|nr:sensor histidine kinase [Cyclobacteriaceae bacterium]